MRKKQPELIGQLLRRYLRQNSLESPLNEQRLIDSWSEIMGPTISDYTDGLYIRNQILYVHLTSSVLRQELMMSRQQLIKNLNNKVGATVIVNIVFH